MKSVVYVALVAVVSAESGVVCTNGENEAAWTETELTEGVTDADTCYTGCSSGASADTSDYCCAASGLGDMILCYLYSKDTAEGDIREIAPEAEMEGETYDAWAW